MTKTTILTKDQLETAFYAIDTAVQILRPTSRGEVELLVVDYLVAEHPELSDSQIEVAAVEIWKYAQSQGR